MHAGRSTEIPIRKTNKGSVRGLFLFIVIFVAIIMPEKSMSAQKIEG
jgi:hypothetical protein